MPRRLHYSFHMTADLKVHDRPSDHGSEQTPGIPRPSKHVSLHPNCKRSIIIRGLGRGLGLGHGLGLGGGHGRSRGRGRGRANLRRRSIEHKGTMGDLFIRSLLSLRRELGSPRSC